MRNIIAIVATLLLGVSGCTDLVDMWKNPPQEPPVDYKHIVADACVSIAVPAVIDFNAQDHFVAGNSGNKVVIDYMSAQFLEHFGSKVESGEVAAETLTGNDLLGHASDTTIIKALGGEERVTITLGQFFAAIAQQPKGEKGALLTNGYANVAYVVDVTGHLAVVYAYWIKGAWNLGASPLEPHGWYEGRFLSR